jgi:single-stranded-DNA-specific exonuclease
LARRWAERFTELGITEGSRIDITYRLRHNRYPDYSGIELEIEDLKLA